MKHPILLLLAACLSLPIASATSADLPDPTLYNFRDPDVTQVQAQNWSITIKPNAAGKRGTATFEPSLDAEKGSVARLTSLNAAEVTLVSPEITLPSNATPIGFQIEYRIAPDSSPVTFMAEDGDAMHKTVLPSGAGKWQQQVITQFVPDEKGKLPPLDLKKLRKISFSGKGDVDLSIAFIKLLYAERKIPLATYPRSITVVPQEETPPILDGKLNDGAWKNAALVSALPFATPGTDSKGFPTEVRVLRSGAKLWLGVKLQGEPAPFAGHSDKGRGVWKDSSLEVFLAPKDEEAERFQMALNSLNTREITGTKSRARTWGGAWQSAVSKGKDGWTAELAIDLTDLDPSWNEHAIWRWNVVRNVSTADKVTKSRTGLTEPAFALPLTALLVFEPVEINPDAKDFALIKAGPTEYTLVLPHPWGKAPGTVRFYKVSDKIGANTWMKTEEIAPSDTFARLELNDSGLYRLRVDQTGPDEQTRLTLLEFTATVPLQSQWDDIVLWPTPQKLELGDENLPLSRITSVEQQGGGDAYPAELLRKKLESRYGFPGKDDAKKAVKIILHYDKDAKIPEEGYHLAVDADGVTITATSGRGMYYGVRTLLNLTEQSTLDLSQPQIRHARIEDWPEVATRVCHYLVASHHLPNSVEALKRFIYKEVAGGRFNLFILVPTNYYHYAVAPEIANGQAWTREQYEEVIDFARKNYVDVAPGGSSPGHASWLTKSHPEFSDGSLRAVDLSNPEMMKKMLACYDELLDVFKPRYFHIGADEWHPNLTKDGKSPEELRPLFLAHLKQLDEHFKARGVQMIMWDDMLSPNWNGRPPLDSAKILNDVPKDIIMATWGVGYFINDPSVYRDLGFKQVWSILTGFRPKVADGSLEWWKDYDAVGMGIYIQWPWSTFPCTGTYQVAVPYTAGALHLNALLGWHPYALAQGAISILNNQGVHWMRTMTPPELGRTDIHVTPVSLADISEHPVPKLLQPALEAFAETSIGHPPYQFNVKAGQGMAAVASDKRLLSIPVNRKIAGLFFLHTTAAAKNDLHKLGRQLLRENKNPFGMEIGTYEIQYADGRTVEVPIILGYNIQFFDVSMEAAIMEGSPAYFTGTAGQESAKAWVLTWKNPRPDVPVKSVRMISSNESTPITLLGLNAAEITR